MYATMIWSQSLNCLNNGSQTDKHKKIVDYMYIRLFKYFDYGLFSV